MLAGIYGPDFPSACVPLRSRALRVCSDANIRTQRPRPEAQIKLQMNQEHPTTIVDSLGMVVLSVRARAMRSEGVVEA